jgi:hypothetical protein
MAVRLAAVDRSPAAVMKGVSPLPLHGQHVERTRSLPLGACCVWGRSECYCSRIWTTGSTRCWFSLSAEFLDCWHAGFFPTPTVIG